MAEENAPSLRDTISSAVDTAEAAPNEAPASTPAPSESGDSAPAEHIGSQASEASPTAKEPPSYLSEEKPDEEKLPESTKEGGKPDPKPEDAAAAARARVDRPPQSWKGDRIYPACSRWA
jgi:hypothetical protein